MTLDCKTKFYLLVGFPSNLCKILLQDLPPIYNFISASDLFNEPTPSTTLTHRRTDEQAAKLPCHAIYKSLQQLQQFQRARNQPMKEGMEMTTEGSLKIADVIDMARSTV